MFCLSNDLSRSQKAPGVTGHGLVLTQVPGGHGDQGVHAVAGGVVGAVRVLGPRPRPRQQPHLGQEEDYKQKVKKVQNYFHRDGENDRHQDDREDAAEADHQDAGEVDLEEKLYTEHYNNKEPSRDLRS